MNIKYVLFPSEKSDYNDIFDTMNNKSGNQLAKQKRAMPNSQSVRGDILKESQKVPIFPNQYPKKKDDKEASNPLLTEKELTNPMFALGSQQDVQALFSKILIKQESAEKKNKRYQTQSYQEQSLYCNSILTSKEEKKVQVKKKSPKPVARSTAPAQKKEKPGPKIPENKTQGNKIIQVKQTN